jgi:hypothetical protein
MGLAAYNGANQKRTVGAAATNRLMNECPYLVVDIFCRSSEARPNLRGIMQPQMLLVVLVEERRCIYEEFLAREQVSCRVVPSLREMVTQAAKFPHCGVLLDMPIIVKASLYDKNLAEDAMRGLPCARLNISRKSGDILVLPIGVSNEKKVTASEFVRTCCAIPPKIVFIRNRIPLHLNAMLSRSPDMADAVQTVCIDFSEGGCFLYSTDTNLVPQTPIWIRLIGLSDQSPIQGMICWKREWGIVNKIPGIGIRFDVLTGKQQEEILAVISRHRAT